MPFGALVYVQVHLEEGFHEENMVADVRGLPGYGSCRCDVGDGISRADDLRNEGWARRDGLQGLGHEMLTVARDAGYGGPTSASG